MHFIDRYLDWLINILALIFVVMAVAPMWPWPFDYWPGGAIGGLVTFIWLGMLAMDWIERKTGSYWITKIAALFVIAVMAAVVGG